MQIDVYFFLSCLSSVVEYAPSGNELCGTCNVIIEDAIDYGDYTDYGDVADDTNNTP
jgi:hypothetical protein